MKDRISRRFLSVNSFLIFGALILLSCSKFEPKLTPEQTISETEQVIQILKTQPDWLNENIVCPTQIIPKKEKKVNYLEGGCENNPKRCLNDCKNEDGNACYSLALLIQNRIDIEQKETLQLFYRSCKFGIISGCTNYAATKDNLEDDEPELDRCLVDTFEKTCEMDDAWGCTMFGMFLIDGQVRPQNLDQASKALQKGCMHGLEDDACKKAKLLENEILIIKSKK